MVGNIDLNIEELTNKQPTLAVCFTSLWNSIDSYHHHTFQNSKMVFNELKKGEKSGSLKFSNVNQPNEKDMPQSTRIAF